MKKLFFSLVIILFFFALLEISARLQDMICDGLGFFPRERPVVYEEGAYLPAVPIPTLRKTIAGHEYQHNSYGFRGNEFSPKKDKDVYRIVCLGGSSTYGNQLSNYETWPAQLERLLNSQQQGMHLEVINAGVGGYTTMESLINLVTRVLPLEPNMIIIYHAFNDFKPNRFPNFKSDYTNWRSRERTPKKHILNILSSKSSFARNMVSLYRKLSRYLDKRLKYHLPTTGLRRYDTVSEEGIESFKRNLRTMIYVTRGYGITPVISTFCLLLNEENLQAHPEKFEGLLDYIPTLTYAGVLDAKRRYNQALREVAKQEKVLLIDNSLLIPETLQYQYDSCHFTAAGARLIAENFSQAISIYLNKGPKPKQ
jgi:lysophospholipase L1-like esterase